MKPQIIEKGTLKLMGIVYFGDNKKGEIPQLWQKCCHRIIQLPQRTNPDACYGVCFYLEEYFCNGNGQFNYMIAVEADDFSNMPDTMVGKVIPPYRYAVFTHKGPISEIHRTYTYIYQSGLAEAGLKHAAQFDFEYYDHRFRDESKESEMDIYIPIEKL